MKHTLITLILFILVCQNTQAQEDITVNPGVDRWAIKTSIAPGESKNVKLSDLLQLPLLAPKYSAKAYATTLIPEVQAHGIKEGDIITTTGYLRLIALEDDSKKNRDGDYHIQLTLTPESTDSCFIVEIPYSEFITDATLKAAADARRQFLRDELLNGNEPSKSGSVMQSAVYVKVTGQLFYDAIHASGMRGANPRYRGKKGMHSYTAWELHPVTDIAFVNP